MGNTETKPEGVTHTLTFDDGPEGGVRSVLVYIPNSLSQPPSPPGESQGLYPVVVSMHGGGGNPFGWQGVANTDSSADRNGFVVVYPAGSHGGAKGKKMFRSMVGEKLLVWHAAEGKCGQGGADVVDDVGFICRVVRSLLDPEGDDGRNVLAGVGDPTRIWATGLSNGGYMAYRLLVEAPEYFAAVVPVGGIIGPDETVAGGEGEWAEDRVVRPVLHVHSVDDPRALYGGGEGPPFPMTKRTIHQTPVEEALRKWAGYCGIEVSAEHGVVDPGVGEVLARDEETGHTATLYAYQGVGGEEHRLSFIQLTGGVGHVWPSSPHRPLLNKICGPATTVINMADVLFEFCSSCPPLPVSVLDLPPV